MERSIKLSVVIPVYNSSQFIDKCLEGIISSYRYIYEIILIDDGSIDNSFEICKNYSKKIDYVKTIHQENAGVSSARNVGIEAAQGDYIMFVDSDDFVDGSLIEDLCSTIGNHDIAIAGYSLFNDNINRTTHCFPCFNASGSVEDLAGNIEKYLKPPYMLGPCFKIFKRSIIIENNVRFPKDISYCEDAIFVFDYLNHAPTFVSVCNPGYYYRQHGNETLSTKFKKNLFDCEVLLNRKMESFVRVNHKEFVMPLLDERLFNALVIYIRKLSCSTLPLEICRSIIVEQTLQYNLQGLVKRTLKGGFDSFVVRKVITTPNLTFLIKLLYIEVRLKVAIKKIIRR